MQLFFHSCKLLILCVLYCKYFIFYVFDCRSLYSLQSTDNIVMEKYLKPILITPFHTAITICHFFFLNITFSEITRNSIFLNTQFSPLSSPLAGRIFSPCSFPPSLYPSQIVIENDGERPIYFFFVSAFFRFWRVV